MRAEPNALILVPKKITPGDQGYDLPSGGGEQEGHQ
jgi:hypothetical protein